MLRSPPQTGSAQLLSDGPDTPTTSGPSTPNTELGGEGETGNNVPDDTQATGGGEAHDNIQPSAVVQWIIKALPDEPPPPPVDDSAGQAPYTLFNSLFE